MSATIASFKRREGVTQRATTEPLLVRWALTAVALLFLAFFLFVPLAAVFAQALEKGFATYLASFRRSRRRWRRSA